MWDSNHRRDRGTCWMPRHAPSGPRYWLPVQGDECGGRQSTQGSVLTLPFTSMWSVSLYHELWWSGEKLTTTSCVDPRQDQKCICVHRERGCIVYAEGGIAVQKRPLAMFKASLYMYTKCFMCLTLTPPSKHACTSQLMYTKCYDVM